jgi:hypothetical protein
MNPQEFVGADVSRIKALKKSGMRPRNSENPVVSPTAQSREGREKAQKAQKKSVLHLWCVFAANPECCRAFIGGRICHWISPGIRIGQMLFVPWLAGTLLAPPVAASTVRAWGESVRPPGVPPSLTTNVPAHLLDAVGVAGGPDIGYAIRSNGSVITWGNPLVSALSRVPLDLADAIDLGPGSRHTLALRRNGTVMGWGEDRYGKTDAPPLLDRVMAIAVGENHSLALRRNGTVVAWGDYSWGQPTAIPVGLNDAVAIAAAANYSLALRRNGRVVAWGGQFNATNVSDTVKVPQDLSNVVAIAASYFEAFALRDDGTVVHWGTGVQAGPIPGLTRIAAISGLAPAGLLALREEGTLVQSPPQPSSPIPSGLSNVVAIGGRGTPSVALIRAADEPFILQHPQSRSVQAGSPVSFRVAAVAGQALSYQWQFNGGDLRGATQEVLALKAAWPAQAGHYRARVTAAGLMIPSRAALLGITPP